MKARRQCDDISKGVKEKSHPEILYTVNLTFKNEGKICTFLDKGKKNSEEFELPGLPYKKY